MAKPESRICHLHELVVRDGDGRARAFHYGEVVILTPSLIAALGEYVSAFEALPNLSTMVVRSTDLHHR